MSPVFSAAGLAVARRERQGAEQVSAEEAPEGVRRARQAAPRVLGVRGQRQRRRHLATVQRGGQRVSLTARPPAARRPPARTRISEERRPGHKGAPRVTAAARGDESKSTTADDAGRWSTLPPPGRPPRSTFAATTMRTAFLDVVRRRNVVFRTDLPQMRCSASRALFRPAPSVRLPVQIPAQI